MQIIIDNMIHRSSIIDQLDAKRTCPEIHTFAYASKVCRLEPCASATENPHHTNHYAAIFRTNSLDPGAFGQAGIYFHVAKEYEEHVYEMHGGVFHCSYKGTVCVLLVWW